MTFPTSDVSTTNLDSSTDGPANARSDFLDLFTKFNLLRNHFSTLAQTLVSRATAALMRGDLGATAVGDAVFTAADAAAGRTALGAQASLGYTAADDAAVVKLTGSQTIAGNKTFSSGPTIGSAPLSVPTGSAPIHGARAWCVFDGSVTGTNAPLAGGNVSSVTRNAVGDYTINFSTPMPDAFYGLASASSATASPGSVHSVSIISRTTTSIRVRADYVYSGVTSWDPEVVSLSIFR